MSKILPVKDSTANQMINKNDNNDDQYDPHNKCPRYQKWHNKRIGPEDNVRRRRPRQTPVENKKSIVKSESPPPVINKRQNSIGRTRSSTKTDSDTKSIKKYRPLRTRSVFIKIRQKGRNFGIRCKTSVELWRKWITRGIRWDLKRPPPQRPMDKLLINDSLIPPNVSKTNGKSGEKTSTSTSTSSSSPSTSSKVFGFVKKSIITEVIPEEEEVEPDDNSKTTTEQQRPQKDGTNNQQSIKIEINENNATSKSAHGKKKKDSKTNDEHTTKDNREDLDKIEPVANHQNDDDDDQEDDQNRSEKQNGDDDDNDDDDETVARRNKSKNAIRRAFNKLKLFF